MYFCYVDESGDVGAYDATKPDRSGSPYFILVGLIVPVDNWKNSLDYLKSFRKTLAAQAYLPYDVEFHCSELIDTHRIKEYVQISIADRWKLIDRFAEIVGNYTPFKIITVVIDKTKSSLSADMYLTSAINRLYQLFDEFLRKQETYGSVLFDRASEKVITTYIRKLMNTGSSGQTVAEIRIGRIVEDPIFRV